MLNHLEKISGLGIRFDTEKGELVFNDPRVKKVEPQKRTLRELQEYLKEELAPQKAGETAYLIYRNIARSEDDLRFKATGIRYDITIIPPRRISGEFIKTAGHYHPQKLGTLSFYPEVIEIISGHGYFLLQKKDSDDDGLLREIFLVEAMLGEKFMCQPGFGHTSINAFDEPLIFSNLIGNTFSYDYEGYRRHHGAGYWLVESPNHDMVDIEKNTFYKSVPDIKKLRPKEAKKLGLVKKVPLYTMFVKDPGTFRYLTEPEHFKQDLTIAKCYKVI